MPRSCFGWLSRVQIFMTSLNLRAGRSEKVCNLKVRNARRRGLFMSWELESTLSLEKQGLGFADEVIKIWAKVVTF